MAFRFPNAGDTDVKGFARFVRQIPGGKWQAQICLDVTGSGYDFPPVTFGQGSFDASDYPSIANGYPYTFVVLSDTEIAEGQVLFDLVQRNYSLGATNVRNA